LIRRLFGAGAAAWVAGMAGAIADRTIEKSTQSPV
jgi:hypothetical protein